MIYTVGLKVRYDAKLRNGGLFKEGKRDGYRGGWVWRTPEEAYAFLVKRGDAHIRGVYGVLASWEHDTYQVPGRSHRSLLRTAPVVAIGFQPN